VNEAVANALVHAYDGSGMIDVSVRDVADELEVVVTDCGRGVRAGESIEQGLGLGLIEQLTSRFALTSSDGGTRVEMVFG
jgi:anti-sigma regulatory factor (Ser/Thr protein kinase)